MYTRYLDATIKGLSSQGDPISSLRPSLPGTFHNLNRKNFLFRYHIFQSDLFVINFSYFVIRFLLNISIVKSDNEIGKVNEKKNLI